MKNNILVIAAHPDDELLGPGGTIIKHSQDVDAVYALILGEGIMARTGGTDQAVQRLRHDARKAGKVLGIKETFFAKFPDNRFDTVSLLDIVKEVEKYLEQIQPRIIYTHHEYDLNVDHRMTFEAVLTASRPCNENRPNELYTFETLSSTEWQSKQYKQFEPSVYVDIEPVIAKKIEALQEYVSEIKDYPHPRSAEGIKILASYRGLESGFKFAEAFHLVRKIQS